MAINREAVGLPFEYQGRTIIARLAKPDLLGYVDHIELSGFFLNVEAVRVAGMRYVDDKLKAERERQHGRA